MRRIIHNTTAIVTCLSLLAPQFAAAQDAPAEKPKDGLAALLSQVQDAVEAENQPAGAEADVPAEPVTEAEAAPAPKPQTEQPMAEDAAPKAKPEQEVNAQPEAAAPEAEAQQAEAQRAEAQRAEAQRAEAQRAEAQRAEPTEPAKEEKKPEKKPKKDDAPAEAAAEEPNPGILGEVGQAARESQAADELAEQMAKDEEAKKAADEKSAADSALVIAGGSVQTERANEMPGLAKVLSDEMAAGLTLASLTCLTGGALPCAEGDRAQTPRGVVIEQNGASEFRLAASENQMLRLNKSGDLVQRAAEENTKETEASREAAQQSEPVSAAALDASEGSGNVTKQEVTQESTRSSSEDFATSLRDALSGDTKEAKKDDDDNNNLTKALLLGAGALAVGSYLNNNRQVALSAPDRVVVTREDGSQEVIKDEVALLRQPGSNVSTENFDDGSSRTIVTRQDGSRVVTIRDADLRVLRRTLVSADGITTQLIDDTTDVQPVDLSTLPAPAEVQTSNASLDEDALRTALRRESNTDRRFTLSQIRNIPEVRSLVAPVNIDAITFDTGSAAIRPDQAKQLQSLGSVIQESITSNPSEIFMIEGYTDTVGADAFNLALSDRRAESVALALTEYFDVPPENLVTQGYGEQYLRVRAEGDIRDNRRASVRRITDLLRTAQAQ